MPEKKIKFRLNTIGNKKKEQKIAEIMDTMIPVSSTMYEFQKLDSKRFWINDDDYYEKVFVKKLNTFGLLFIYHNPDVKKLCSLDALFLPKKRLFQEEWERIKNNLIEIDYDFNPMQKDSD